MATRMWFDVDRVVELVEIAHEIESEGVDKVDCRCGASFRSAEIPARDQWSGHWALAIRDARNGRLW